MFDLIFECGGDDALLVPNAKADEKHGQSMSLYYAPMDGHHIGVGGAPLAGPLDPPSQRDLTCIKPPMPMPAWLPYQPLQTSIRFKDSDLAPAQMGWSAADHAAAQQAIATNHPRQCPNGGGVAVESASLAQPASCLLPLDFSLKTLHDIRPPTTQIWV